MGGDFFSMLTGGANQGANHHQAQFSNPTDVGAGGINSPNANPLAAGSPLIFTNQIPNPGIYANSPVNSLSNLGKNI